MSQNITRISIETIPKHPRSVLIYHIFHDLKQKKLDNWRLLKLEDIGGDYFRISIKGEFRYVPFQENTRNILENYLKIHPGVSPYLFCYNQGFFSQSVFSQMFKEILGVSIMQHRTGRVVNMTKA